MNLDLGFLVALRSKLWCQLIHTNARLPRWRSHFIGTVYAWKAQHRGGKNFQTCLHASGLQSHLGWYIAGFSLNYFIWTKPSASAEHRTCCIVHRIFNMTSLYNVMEIDVKQYKTIISHHLHIGALYYWTPCWPLPAQPGQSHVVLPSTTSHVPVGLLSETRIFVWWILISCVFASPKVQHLKKLYKRPFLWYQISWCLPGWCWWSIPLSYCLHRLLPAHG